MEIQFTNWHWYQKGQPDEVIWASIPVNTFTKKQFKELNYEEMAIFIYLITLAAKDNNGGRLSFDTERLNKCSSDRKTEPQLVETVIRKLEECGGVEVLTSWVE